MATGHNPPGGIWRGSSTKYEHRHPADLLDPTQALAREMAVMGLPVTVILDREGREMARLHRRCRLGSPTKRTRFDYRGAYGRRNSRATPCAQFPHGMRMEYTWPVRVPHDWLGFGGSPQVDGAHYRLSFATSACCGQVVR